MIHDNTAAAASSQQACTAAVVYALATSRYLDAEQLVAVLQL